MTDRWHFMTGTYGPFWETVYVPLWRAWRGPLANLRRHPFRQRRDQHAIPRHR